MKYLLGVLGAGAAVFGVLAFVAANGAIHEIEALLAFILAAVLLIGAAVIHSIDKRSAVLYGASPVGTSHHGKVAAAFVICLIILWLVHQFL